MVKQVLQNKNIREDVTLNEVLTMANVILEHYTKALSISKCGQSIILKRQPSEQNVNCYSPAVLRAWGKQIWTFSMSLMHMPV